MKKIIEALTSGNYADLPEDFTKKDALRLFSQSKIDSEVFGSYIDHLLDSAKATPTKSNDLRFKVGEKNWCSLSAGNLGVAFQKPLNLKANTLLALLTVHREEILERLKAELEGEYDIQTREGSKGDYNVLLKGNVVIGSANSTAQIEKQKGIIEHCLSMVS